MAQKIYQIDAFAERAFSGNPAAVCPLDKWLSDDILQNIAMENNLSETAFFVKHGEHYQLRWFTPALEVDLCGHATLAAAYVLFNYEGHRENEIQFISPRSGPLTVTKNEDLLILNFPTDSIKELTITEEITACFNIAPHAAYKGKTDYMLVFDHEAAVRNLIPSFANIAALDARGVIITAEGDDVDFVSRFFAPQCGVDEDPVTGSAHTTLIPYWANKLGKNEMTARQLSKRQGYLHCTYLNDRVEIGGRGRLYMIGEIFF